MAFSLFDQKQKSTRDLSKDSASFLWNQLLLHVLKKLPQDEQAKHHMLSTCADFYALNQQELQKIETFQKTYSREHAIEWYTDECFLYKLLNRAIRTENIELLHLFRYFIIDLCAELERESKKLKTAGMLTLFRGQQIPTEEFEKIRNNVGTLISTNGFLSTSRDINVALQFARQFRINSDMQTCILEIHADPTLDTVVFADIHPLSKIKQEQEVLFGLNATFKIDRVEMDRVLKMWKIILITTADGSARIEEYKRMLEDRMKEHSPVIYFGRLLLYDLGRVDQAGKYFAELLNTLPPDHPDISSVYNNIGNVYRAQGDLNLALKNYEEAYEIRQKVLPSNHSLIAASLNNIGLIYGAKEEFDSAIDSYYQALKIDEKNYPGDHLDKSHTILNIGLAWKSKGHLETALIWVNRALDMFTRLLPVQHPDIASCLGFIGGIHDKQGNLDRALVFYCRRLEMEEECLPSDHPNLSEHLNAIARTYKKNDDKQKAFIFCKKQLASQTALLGDVHPRIASTLMTIGDICAEEERRQYYQQALSIIEKCAPRNELIMLDCLGVLGAIALDEGKLREGLAHWRHVLDIRRKIHSRDHPAIAKQLEGLGDAYFKAMHDCPEALHYYSESLAIFRANYGDQHSDVIRLEEQIQEVRQKMKN